MLDPLLSTLLAATAGTVALSRSYILDPLLSTLLAATAGNAALFRFYLRHALAPFRLPRELYDEGALAARAARQQPFKLVASRRIADDFALGLDQLQREISRISAGPPAEHTRKQVLFWLVRFGSVAAAAAGSLRLVLAVSALQFVFLPYSLFVAIAYGVETVLVLYTGHAIVTPTLTAALDAILPSHRTLALTLSPRLVLGFFVADQLLCAACLVKTQRGATARVPPHRILASVLYGFLNTKTYYLVLLPMCVGISFPVLPWIVDAALGLSATIARRLERYWQVLFYPVHRMGHLKHVYADAHKFHHCLHDCTAFDAHIFGSGAPEEWLILASDLMLGCRLGFPPASLSAHVLSVSWFNKWAFHTRHALPDFHPDNFHADHHVRHRVNYGIAYPYDLYFKTTPPELGAAVEWGGYRVERAEDECNVTLSFAPLDGAIAHAHGAGADGRSEHTDASGKNASRASEAACVRRADDGVCVGAQRAIRRCCYGAS